MGTVYEAEHLLLGTRVAIKVLHPELVRRAGLVERFLQEARVSAQIKSSHVVQVLDVDQTPDGVAYIVMELLEGEPLSKVLEREGRLEPARACDYARQILEALEAAHALSVVHRDLKPENVFVTVVAGKPNLKLIDFGIAKLRRTEEGAKNLTVAGMLMGTAEYMAPEQAYSADRADARSDIYAVGVMLFEMLSGTRPVVGEDARLIAIRIEKGDVTPLIQVAPFVKPELAGLVHRALAARPDMRFANATEMRLALEAVEAGRPLGTAQATPAKLEEGTGTMMGAPVPAALTAPVPMPPARGPGPNGGAPGGPHPELATTHRAGPVGQMPPPGAYGPPQGAGMRPQGGPVPPQGGPMAPQGAQVPQRFASGPPPRRRGTPLWPIALVALLVGGGVGAVLILNSDDAKPVVTPDPTRPVVTTPTATAVTTAHPVDTTAPLATLSNPTTVPPTVGPRPTGTVVPHPTATGTATAQPTTTPTQGPFVMPTGLPSGFPTVLPTVFVPPTGWPTWPPPPPQ
jgi:serine/threonine-protein kinase